MAVSPYPLRCAVPQADVAPQKKEFTEISEKILGALAAGPKHTREVVAAITGVQATAVLETIHELVARERVVITNDWRLRVAD